MEALEKLEEKINRAVSLIEKLNGEKQNLTLENSDLKTKLTDLESKLGDLEKSDNKKAELVKEKLNGILGKLETLEQF